VWVAHRAGDTGRLVEYEVDERGSVGADALAVDRELILRRIHELADPCRVAVHGHATGRDQFFGLAPRSYARVGQGFVYSNVRLRAVTH
jgi:hypothetical protein